MPTAERLLLAHQQHKFSNIIWASDFWATIDEEQCLIAKAFAEDISMYFSTTLDEVSFQERWDLIPPVEANGSSLLDYTVKV